MFLKRKEISNDVEDQGCSQEFSAIRRITYIAIDKSGNESAICTRIVYYRKVGLGEILFPPNKDNIEDGALDCANKEGWDNIDLFGWLGYPMQLKVDFLCRDSILAAPLCLDLVLFSDLAQRAGMSGIQGWLSFYFKSPMHEKNQIAEHDLFIQYVKLKNTLRKMIGEETVDFID